MARTAGLLSLGTKYAPSRLRWLSSWHIPHSFKQALPRLVILGLRELKGRALTQGTVWDFPRHIQFEQSPEDALASASMSILVPIHDAPAVTRRCLGSLEKYAREAEIILVDDASSLTETLEIIWNFSSRNGWKVVRHENPFGHSEACRAGARFATRPYLCLLNSDTVATPWCWRQIKEVFESDKKIGVAGPCTSHASNVQTIPLAATLCYYWNDNQICAFAKHLLTAFPESVVVDLPWISGFAFFIRRSLWEEVGGFDEKLPDYGNEVELCTRIGKMGYRMVWVRNSYVHHFGRESYRREEGPSPDTRPSVKRPSWFAFP